MKKYLTAKELAQELGFSANYINRLKDKFFIEGIHYIRPFGRSIRYVWPEINNELNKRTKPSGDVIPMKRGGYCHG